MVKCSVSKAWKVDQVGRQEIRLEHLVIAIGEGLLCLAWEFGLNPASKRVACESSAGALAQTVKNLSAVQETWFNPIGSHRHRSLVGYSS